MKVAIIGAGVSGLSCAFELRKHGCTPVVFEKQSQVGEPMNYTGMWASNFIRHFGDPIYYIKKKYNLDIKPLCRYKEIIMKFPNGQVNVKGNLGYIMERSSDIFSLENQIARQADVNIIFNSAVKVEDIKNDFDYVVVAGGYHNPADKLGIWSTTTISHSRVTRVRGDFIPGVCKTWFNTEYANHSFCYLVPKSSKVATLAQILDSVQQNQYDSYWDRFITMEKLNYEVIEKKDTNHYSGIVSPMQKENIFFIGNAAGLTDNFMGVGAYNAIISGICAARSIINNLNYDKIMSPYRKDIIKLHELRKAVNTFKNENFDMIGSVIGNSFVKQLIYLNPLFKMKHAAPVAKIYNWFKCH
ncbi:MAG: hypothetical protein A2Y22_02125 [Clostridiales bacterium GWD2_32_59]|nr:MAG: hypothetical protein A2Y22_02125 [Clostridiales bacterium GWD2_32_59]